MKRLFFLFLIIGLQNLNANDYNDGAKLFKKKCSSCHIDFIDPKKIKDNFFKKDNKLLKLKAPTLNMLRWAINIGPNKIGDDSDLDFKAQEVADFLVEYLYNPKQKESICDKDVIKYFKIKESMKGKVSKSELLKIAHFLVTNKAKK
jgi:hypothetical protein